MRVLLLQPLTLLSRRVAEWHHVKMENDSRHESLPDDKQAARQTQRITNDMMMVGVIMTVSFCWYHFITSHLHTLLALYHSTVPRVFRSAQTDCICSSSQYYDYFNLSFILYPIQA